MIPDQIIILVALGMIYIFARWDYWGDISDIRAMLRRSRTRQWLPIEYYDDHEMPAWAKEPLDEKVIPFPKKKH